MTAWLRVVQGEWEHRLACALRFDDHFFRTPVAEDLIVQLTSSGPYQPLRSAAGQPRHGDGTYRFADLPDGHYDVGVQSPSRRFVSWTTPLAVALPLAHPTDAVVYELWPTATAPAVPGITTARGRLVGAGVANLQVELAPVASGFSGRFTRADASGEFLFPLPGKAALESDGRLLLAVRVDGGARTVTGGVVGAGPAAVTFAGAELRVVPSRESRVTFNV